MSTFKKSKSDINSLIKYWQVKNTMKPRKPIAFLVMTWEPDFPRHAVFAKY